MLKNINATQDVYIVCGYTDMRSGIDGLAGVVKMNFGMDPFSSSMFLFCGRRSDRLKALLWEDDGFLLLYKRLENGRFRWPRTEDEVKKLSYQQFRWLIEGLEIEQPKAIKNAKLGDLF